jgi:nucleoid-associated protein YgaU
MTQQRDGPEKLTILVEKKGGKLVFEKGDAITALFNPNRLTFSKSANWQTQNAAQRDSPELQFTNSDPRTLSLDLTFDTYDTPGIEKEDVRKHTNKLLALTTVEGHGDKHRPPVCRLCWGRPGPFFQGVLQQLEQTFTLFTATGMPVRATVKCTFKEWRTNYEDSVRQAKESSDVAKQHVFKRGDSLALIAAEEYRDPRKWRAIAIANHIRDPLNIPPGAALRVPALEE